MTAAVASSALIVSGCSSTQDSEETSAVSSANSANSSAVTVITTGGTIASKHESGTGAVTPALSGQELMNTASVPKDISVTVKELARLDSSAMTLADTDRILAAVDKAFEDGAQGVVITHGTDSMEETAMAVDAFLKPGHRVVLTGAMRPADDPDPDGPRNLTDAILAAAGRPLDDDDTDDDNVDENEDSLEDREEDLGESEPVPEGAYIAFGGHLTPARGAYKTNTESTDGFASNKPTHDGDQKEAQPRTSLRRSALAKTDVRIVTAWPGASRRAIDDAVASGADGIVVEAMGSGNVGGEIAEGIADALRKGIPVVMSTRVPGGPVSGTYGGAGGGATLLSEGAIGSGYLRSPQSRILLAAALAAGADPQEVFAEVQ